MRMRPLFAIVLAAGDSPRMHSSLSKPLHRLCGRPMVDYVLDALVELEVDRAVVVVGHGANDVVKAVQAEHRPNLPMEFVEQVEPLGTGDAVGVGLTGLPGTFGEEGEADLIVLPADAPLLRPPTLAALVRLHRVADAAATVLTADVDMPAGYGRVVRSDDERIVRVVEDADADASERQLHEIATSVYCFRHAVLAPVLRRLSPDNARREYYLSGTVEQLRQAGYAVESLCMADPTEAAGVNDLAQLAAAEAVLRSRHNERLMRRGVTMVDPEQTYLEAGVTVEPDVTLLPGTILGGSTVVRAGAVVGPATRLTDCEVGERAVVESTVGERAVVGADCRVGPWASLEPGSRLAPGTVTGPFFRGSTDAGA
jgi:bifunctional UDP-N-acetylglucosamine pyrophosphorylase / glucosamine-1-phosphate N-acetyltransferase